MFMNQRVLKTRNMMKMNINNIVTHMLEIGYEKSDPEIELLSNDKLKWDNPEQVFCLHCFSNEQALKNVIKRLYPTADYKALTFLFQHYDFLENQIQFVLKDFSKHGGLCDKSRWVLKQWFKSLIGEEPEEISKKGFFRPDFGKTNLWIQFCEVCMSIYYTGFTSSNIEFMQVIDKMAKEKLNGGY